MKNKYFQIFLWIITIILLAGVFMLPQTVPIHWDINGKIDNYTSRYVCVILALIPIAVYYMMILTRKIDPNQEKIKKRMITYELMNRIMAVFFIAFDIFYYYMVLVEDAHVQTGISLIIGLFILVIGNYLPKVPQNFFLGIKTPWTLKNETVWKKTHKVGGYAFMILGLLTIISGFIGEIGFFVMVSVCVITVGFLYVYSYLEYKGKCL